MNDDSLYYGGRQVQEAVEYSGPLRWLPSLLVRLHLLNVIVTFDYVDGTFERRVV